MSQIDSPSSRKLTRNALKGYALVLLAALLWSTLGSFYKDLINTYHIAPLTLAFFRAALSGAILLVSITLFQPRSLAAQWRDLPLLVSFGVLGIAGFFIAYVYAVNSAGVAVAAVLLYTAPAWVTIISWRFLGERISARQWVALALALSGCALVAGVYNVDQIKTNAAGILFGLASGFGYALYSVFNKAAVRRYSPWTVLLYGMGIGAVVLFPLQDVGLLVSAVQTPPVLLRLLGIAVVATLGSGLSFATGLKFVPVSSASVVANLEPVSAAALAFLLFGEVMDARQILGGVMVLAGAILSARQ